MITVKYEHYYNDNNFSHRVENFEDLTHLEKWIYDKMHVGELSKWIRFNYDPAYITLQPEGPGLNVHIHQIEDEDGILFSDGEYTNLQSHVADCVKQWMCEFKERLKAPKYNFVNK